MVQTFSPETISERLAGFALKIGFDDLPNDVVNRTKMTLLDAIGCTIDGSREEVVKKAAELAFILGRTEEATIIGFGQKASFLQATLVNSVMMQIHELDDIALKMHPSRVVFPPVLAIAEWKNASGREFLTAMAIGYEIQILISDLLLEFRKERHISLDLCGAAGTVSVPLAVGRLLGLERREAVSAVGVSCSGGYPSFEGVIEWKPAEVFTCGFIGQRGITSSLLAKKGILADYGPDAVIEGSAGLFQVFSGNMDLIKAHEKLDKLGKEYHIVDAFYYKLIAQCRDTHKAVESALNIVIEHSLKPDDIDTIDILACSHGVVGRFRPKTLAEASFCLPLGVALAILNRRRPIPSDLNLREDANVLELMGKVHLFTPVSDLRLAKEPESTIIEITTKDGRKYIRQMVHQKGSVMNPVTNDELKAKFTKLSQPVLGKKRTKKLLETIERLEEISDVAELTELLSPVKIEHRKKAFI